MLGDYLFKNCIKRLQGMSLRSEIIKNEKFLLVHFRRDYKLAIKFFIKKVESLRTDGDIVKFLNNKSIMKIKKEQYDSIHEMGYKTAIDIMNEYKGEVTPATEIDNLVEGDLITSLTICSIVNNFNIQKGMYYDEEKRVIILKTQLEDGVYEDGWIEECKKIKYCLENEKNVENYKYKIYAHIPNRVCKEIIMGEDKITKVYLFYRYTDGGNYYFGGEYKPTSFVDNNTAIVLEKI